MAIQAFLKNQEKSQSNLPSKGIRKRTDKVQSQQKEGSNKDQRGNKYNTDSPQNRGKNSSVKAGAVLFYF